MSEGPRGWAAPLYALALDRAGAGPGTRLLDLGCGTGELARAATDRGAHVTGVDRDPGAVHEAAALVPEGSFAVGDAHRPPPGRFDAVLAVQLLSHVPDAVALLRAAAATAPRLVATVWGREQECDVSAFGEALAPWLPPRRTPSGPAPLTDPQRLRQVAEEAGLTDVTLDEVVCAFTYPDADELVGPLIASGIGRHAVNRGGPVAVRTAVLDRMEPMRRDDGRYVLLNRFRVLSAATPS